MVIRFNLFVFSLALLFAPCLSDLVISSVDRRIDLTSQVVRISSTLKVENVGTDPVSEVLLPLLDYQSKNLTFLEATTSEGKGKTKVSSASLPIEVVSPAGLPPSLNLTWYSVSLPKQLGKGERLTLDVRAIFTHIVMPLPERISQDKNQLVAFQDSAYYLSPYDVKAQSLSVKLPADTKLERYTKLENTKISGSEIKYGPYENIPSLSFTPILVHFVNNQPFAVAEELIREIEVSHWGNVKITEHYNLIHEGAHLTGEFSRLDYQARPHIGGVSALRNLVAKLPPRAHSVYYRDDIGNISTSHLWGDQKKTQLEIEPRYPLFGGWKAKFTIGYGLPLKDFLFQSDGKRFLDISFGSPINDLVIDKLVVKVILPEGSSDISVSIPFPVEQSHETHFSHLDMVGRPVVVLEKTNVVHEHNRNFQRQGKVLSELFSFTKQLAEHGALGSVHHKTEVDNMVGLHYKYSDQRKIREELKILTGCTAVSQQVTYPCIFESVKVYYKFSSFSLMREPLMLISGFFFLFVACIIYTHADLTISKTSPSYIARLQWDEVQTTIQQVQNIINRCLTIHEKLETSLRDLSRTGDVQACKAARKAADGLLKELSKELKPLLAFIHTSPQATQILTKVEDLVAKERELQEKLMLKHSTVVDCYEKKSAGRDMENRVAPIQQKITALRQEVDDLLEVIDEI